MAHYFPAPNDPADYCNNPTLYNDVVTEVDRYLTTPTAGSGRELLTKLDATGRIPNAGDVKYIYTTKAGPGPIIQPSTESLLDSTTGQPVAPGPKHKRMKICH